MYICPTCGKEIESESLIATHYLACWKEQNLYHKSTPAPHSDDIVHSNSDNMNNFLKLMSRKAYHD